MADSNPGQAKKKGKGLVLAVVAVVLIAGGGGGFWWWRKSHVQAGPPPAPVHVEATGVVPMEPFLVNLADTQASRFLRVTLRLVVDTPDEAKEIEESPVDQVRARSAILEVLATQESSALVTPEGKAALKKTIAERTTTVLKREVRDVLFTDFVVQF